ncbi:eCIS core domain-containing protein [Bradyrhizobium sp. cf659]|uniref:eCIS core domain-containing protein n=1 Tax=Bradyrhizobium sp. cf659 TaxID=1761771 RepID=UPI0008E28412|nr:DUF4157 domain-containing protein [Bradyrhizobium sp. cf659]SFH98767.1 protein of unknown function [Bradyrhizobium sp. cf659]
MSGRTLATAQKQTATPMAPGRILQRKCACGNHAMSGQCEACKGSSGSEGKLTIGSTTDPLEQEADRVADRVVAAPASHSDASVNSIQRFATTTGQGPGVAPPSVERALAGPGTPLRPDLRQDMEHSFGYDFSKVRLHTDDAAARSARDISANAYTSGNDVVFGASKFSPESPGGRRLLAHELAHVVQQDGSGHGGSSGQALVQRDSTSFPPISPDVAKSWGMPPAAAKDTGNAHSAPPEHLRPKQQPRTLEQVIAAGNVDPHKAKVDKDPPMMALGDKFKKVITLALTKKLKGEGLERLNELITPEAIGMMAAFTIVYVASQLTPAGWAADILVGILLAATVLMLGREVIEIVKLLIEFCRKTSNAKSEEDYDEAATLFARAISKLGIDIILAILFHKAGKLADLKPPGPRSPGIVEILKPRGGPTTIRQPVLQPADGLHAVTASGVEFIPAQPKPTGLMAEGQSGVGGPKGASVGGAGKTPAGGGPTGQGAGKPPQKLPGKNLAAADALAKKKPPRPGELIEEGKDLVDSSKAEPEAKSSDPKSSRAESTAGEPSRSTLRKELRQNLEKRIEDLQSRIDEVLQEKKLVQKELQSINNELKSIDEQLKTSKDNSALLERRRNLEAQREKLKKREAEELGSTADLELQKQQAKDLINATGADYLKALTDAACKRKEYTEVKAGGKDEVFGTTGLDLEVDHVYPRSKIFEIPGFEKLSWEQQVKIFNYRKNLKLIPAEVNSSRGNMPYKDWARNNPSSYAKNEAAMKNLSALETTMEAEIVNLIKNPNLIQ